MLEENGNGHKLEAEAKEYLLQSLAEYLRSPVIIKGLKEKYGVGNYSAQAVSYYRKRHKKTIAKRREEWKVDLESDIDLANKKVRVRELAQRYWGFYDKCKGVFGEKEIAVLNSILDQIRREVEGDVMKGELSGRLNINITEKYIEHQLDKEAP